MYKSEIISKLREKKIVTVVRGKTEEEALNIANACIKGGITCIEVTYTNPAASHVINTLKTTYKNNIHVCIGAGTVLDAPTAKNAIEAGASYIVSPAFNAEVATLCNRYAIPYIPGCMTIQEMITAMEHGSEVIKLFPGSVLGENYIKAIKSPLPHMSIMVTGGVTLDNAASWLAKGVDAIGIGGEFNTLAANNEFDAITALSHDFVNAIS